MIKESAISSEANDRKTKNQLTNPIINQIIKNYDEKDTSIKLTLG
jgi:hypothetical protein